MATKKIFFLIINVWECATWHDGFRNESVLCDDFALLHFAEVVRLGLDAGPVEQERVVQDHEVVVENAELVTLGFVGKKCDKKFSTRIGSFTHRN